MTKKIYLSNICMVGETLKLKFSLKSILCNDYLLDKFDVFDDLIYNCPEITDLNSKKINYKYDIW